MQINITAAKICTSSTSTHNQIIVIIIIIIECTVDKNFCEEQNIIMIDSYELSETHSIEILGKGLHISLKEAHNDTDRH